MPLPQPQFLGRQLSRPYLAVKAALPSFVTSDHFIDGCLVRFFRVGWGRNSGYVGLNYSPIQGKTSFAPQKYARDLRVTYIGSLLPREGLPRSRPRAAPPSYGGLVN
jgi:hypothetical protein